jgi:hypothetical protein
MAYQLIGSSNQLTIKSIGGTPTAEHKFPAYLETSEIGYIIDSKELPYAPLSFVNSKIHLRTRQRLSLKFNVFSATAAESSRNYGYLDDIIGWIKPRYQYTQGQYIPAAVNNTGLISISFAGLPKTDKTSTAYGEDLKLHITNFAYSINKDMGYHSSSLSPLTPVAYNLQIDGEILLEFNKTANVTNENKPNDKVNVFGNNNGKAEQIIAYYKNATGFEFDSLSSSGMSQAIDIITPALNGDSDAITNSIIPLLKLR